MEASGARGPAPTECATYSAKGALDISDAVELLLSHKDCPGTCNAQQVREWTLNLRSHG